MIIRIRSLAPWLLLCTLLALGIAGCLQGGGGRAPTGASAQISAPEYEPGEVVVRWTDAAREAALAELDLTVREELDAPETAVLAVPIGREVEIARALAARAGVKWAQPNFIRRVSGMIPNDPLFDRQWGLQKIEAPVAWETTIGSSSVIVAVIDTGVDLGHPDLQGRLVPGRNVLEPELPPQDDGGHGTHVAGIIAATINNGMGTAGVAPGVSIMPIKALKANGSGKDTNVATGVRWAADNGARIINMSFGGTEVSQVLTEAVNYAARKGIVTVVAAGNEGVDTPSYPAATEPNIAVAATDQNDRRGSYSNYGSWIVISAPGSRIWSTSWSGQSSYRVDNGTSMAAPHVSGVIALMLSLRPEMTIAEITETLRATADPLPDPGTGAGRVNAARAVAAVRMAEPTPTATATPTPSRTPTPVPTHAVTRASAHPALAMTYRVPDAASTLYAPFLMRGIDGWTTELTVQSASALGSTVRVHFIPETGGVERVLHFALLPMGSAVISLEMVDLPEGPWRGSAVVTSDAPVTAVVSLAAPTFDSMAYDARPTGSATVYAPLAFKRRNGWSSTLAVQNVGTQPTAIDLTYWSSAGAGEWTESVTVPPLGSRTLDLAEEDLLPDGFAGAVTLTSRWGVPVVVVAAATHTSGSAAAYTGATAGSTSLLAPVLFKNRGTSGMWNSGIQLQNVGTDAAQVIATYSAVDHPSFRWAEATTIPPGGAVTLYQGAMPTLPDGFVGLAHIRVTNGVPVTGVVNETNYDQRISSVYELLGSGEVQRFVPRVLRGADGRNTGMQVLNLGDRPAEVAITYRGLDGAVYARQADVLDVLASRTYYQPAVSGLPEGFVGSAVIVSTNGQPLAIVVNEVRY